MRETDPQQTACSVYFFYTNRNKNTKSGNFNQNVHKTNNVKNSQSVGLKKVEIQCKYIFFFLEKLRGQPICHRMRNKPSIVQQSELLK